MTSTPDFSTVLCKQWSQTLNLIADIFNIPTVLIMKLDGKRIKVFSKNQNNHNPYNIDDSEVFDGSGLYCEHVIKTQNILEVNNALTDPEWDHNPDIKLNQIYYLGVPINYSDGRSFGTLCILDDHEREYQEKYRKLLEHFRSDIESQLKAFDLQQQLIEKKSLNYVEHLICGMAHQLNTPTGISVTALSTLKNTFNEFSKNLRHRQLTQTKFAEFEEKTNNCIDLLSANLDKTSTLVDRFKDISSQFSSDIIVINIDTFMQSMIDVFRQRYKKNVSFSLSSASNIKLTTVPHLLQNVMTQLVENSIEHAFKNKDNNQIMISVKQTDNAVSIFYSDNGKGIEGKIQDDVFTPFFTTTQHNDHVGLGLSVVKKIVVMQLKGKIEILTTRQGTAFGISLSNLTI